MRVIKLGGSLMASGKLAACLDKAEQWGKNNRVVLVPGGGGFADQVRLAQQRWQFNDRTAHEMAILAMQQSALMFKALKPEFALYGAVDDMRQSVSQTGVAIWSPNVAELDRAGVASTWDISSDSLSAWLADALGSDALIVVKSVNINPGLDILKLTQAHVVDASFYQYIQHAAYSITLVDAETFLS